MASNSLNALTDIPSKSYAGDSLTADFFKDALVVYCIYVELIFWEKGFSAIIIWLVIEEYNYATFNIIHSIPYTIVTIVN